MKLKKQEELRRNLDEGKKVARELRSIERDYRQELPPEYFPFTHGERIENQRSQMRQKMRRDLQTHFERLSSSHHGRSEPARSSQSAARASGPLQLAGPETMSPGGARSTIDDRVPMKFVVDYPLFLKPSKHHPYRKLEEYHVQDTMNDALKRYENSLLQKET